MRTILPSLLYKYRDDSARTEEIITKGKIWLATANQLNDPLECKTGQIPVEWKRKSIREMENAQMSAFVMSAAPAIEGKQSFYSLSNCEAKRWFQRLKRLKTRNEKHAATRSFLEDHGVDISRPAELFEKFEDQLLRVGVFSLSECPANQLMWAHYASSHSGLAIGFERASATKLASHEHTMQVVYNNSKPAGSSIKYRCLTVRRTECTPCRKSVSRTPLFERRLAPSRLLGPTRGNGGMLKKQSAYSLGQVR